MQLSFTTSFVTLLLVLVVQCMNDNQILIVYKNVLCDIMGLKFVGQCTSLSGGISAADCM